jgi:NAD+ kinase
MHVMWRGCEESIQWSREFMKAVRELDPDFHEQHPNVIVCVGGDGTLLSAIRICGTPVPNLDGSMPEPSVFLPVNMGTRGYLMNRSQEPQQLARDLIVGNIQRVEFARLRELSSKALAFNELAVLPRGDQASKLAVYVDGQPIADEPVIGSGVLVATSQGSTGWNMACGGSARHPLSHDLSLTFVNPYSPRVPPMVLPAGSKIRIDAHEQSKRPCVLKVDGASEDAGSYKTWLITAGDNITVLYNGDHDFTRRMINKVIR